MPKINLPEYLSWQLKLNKIEKKASRIDRPAIIVEDGFFLDFDSDKTYKGNKGKDMHRGGV